MYISFFKRKKCRIFVVSIINVSIFVLLLGKHFSASYLWYLMLAENVHKTHTFIICNESFCSIFSCMFFNYLMYLFIRRSVRNTVKNCVVAFLIQVKMKICLVLIKKKLLPVKKELTFGNKSMFFLWLLFIFINNFMFLKKKVEVFAIS